MRATRGSGRARAGGLALGVRLWLDCIARAADASRLGPFAVARTTDGGRSWQLIELPQGGFLGDELDFPTPNVGYGGGQRTTDGARTWRLISGEPSIVR